MSLLTRASSVLGKRPGLAALFAGLVAGSAHAPVSSAVPLVLAVPILIAALGSAARTQPPWRAGFKVGWAFGVGHYVVVFYWIGFAFFVDAGTILLMPFLMGALIGGVALFPAAAGAACAVLFRSLGPVGRAGCVAAAFGGMEWARSHAFGGFPWAVHGLAWGAGSPVAQAAAWTGISGLTLLTLFMAGAWAGLLDSRQSWPRRAAGPILSVPLAAGLWAVGVQRLAENPAETTDVRVRLVHTAFAQSLKWDPERANDNFRTLLEATASRGVEAVDYVLWPESATAYRLLDDPGALNLITGLAPQAVFGFGVIRVDAATGDVFNAFAAVGRDDDGEARTLAVYDKIRLVPFGEFTPGPRALVRWGLRAVNQEHRAGLTSGRTRDVIAAGPAGPFRPLVCYEILFPDLVEGGDKRPAWLVHATNDGWFGRTTGPVQHFEHARFRAIETGLPVMRATNNGVTAAIDPMGRVNAKTSARDARALDVHLPAPSGETAFARMGGVAVGLLLVIFAAPVAVLYCRDRLLRQERDDGRP